MRGGFIRWCLILALTMSAAPLAAAEEEQLNNGQDMTRPVARFDIRYEYMNNPGPRDHDDTHVVTLRVDKPFELSPHWLLATRIDLPFSFTNRISRDNPAGDTHFGMSDVLVQAMIINIVNKRFGWALGAQVVFPTASEDEMGPGQYRLVPTLGMRWTTDEILPGSWIALATRWDKSVSGIRGNATKVNELQFAPMVNIPLPDQWFINLFPSTDIRYNLGDRREGDSGRWFVPADVLIGKMLDRTTVASVEVSTPIIDDYKVYDFKVEARIGFFF